MAEAIISCLYHFGLMEKEVIRKYHMNSESGSRGDERQASYIEARRVAQDSRSSSESAVVTPRLSLSAKQPGGLPPSGIGAKELSSAGAARSESATTEVAQGEELVGQGEQSILGKVGEVAGVEKISTETRSTDTASEKDSIVEGGRSVATVSKAAKKWSKSKHKKKKTSSSSSSSSSTSSHTSSSSSSSSSTSERSPDCFQAPNPATFTPAIACSLICSTANGSTIEKTLGAHPANVTTGGSYCEKIYRQAPKTSSSFPSRRKGVA
ncbi:osteocalcin 2-like [Rhinatrema bivittatum]|uniref:osteocalcin 2-like n=1 Tax=Rhinatrema bivittatum TaxID=194408 RepID=UPI00112EE977|nr:osteocalcin 2-like [Rhinatrema bivittatum]